MLLSGQDRKLLAAIARFQMYRDRSGIWAWGQRTRSKGAYMFWSIISGSDIHRDAKIDPSTRFPHLSGVVVHQDAIVEKNCLIMQQVTLGQTAVPGAPHLGENVYVGAGAKILGAVKIGARAKIGANAVVLTDIPADATAVGVPAQTITQAQSDKPKDDRR